MNMMPLADGGLQAPKPRHGIDIDSWQAFALLCALSLIPLLAVGFPPLVDLYGHLGRYAMQTDLANRPELQPFYSFEWQLVGNLGADLLVELLHGWLGLETAVRVIVMATQLLSAAAVLLVSRQVHGRITPFAIAALPLIYGLPFNHGFLNFSLGMTLGMLAFVGWMRLRRTRGGIAARVWLAVAGMMVWVSHAYGWAFLGLLCGSTTLAEVIDRRDRPVAALKHILGECWTLLLPLAPMIIWRTESGGMDLIASTPIFKLLGLVSPLRTRWMVLDVLSFFGLVVTIYWAIRNPAIRIDKRLGIAALLCFACFLILPKQVFGSLSADLRLMPYVLMIALLAIPTAQLGRKTIGILTVAALVFFTGRTLATTAAYVADEDRVNAVLPAIDALPQGARVAFFSAAPCKQTWALPVLDHVAGVAHARRSVFVNNQWQVPGASPLTVHYAAAGRFAHDPSHLVLADGCDRDFYPFLSAVLAELPYDAFTHVWIVGELPDTIAVPARLEAVPHQGQGALYAIRPAR
ncbi:MAG: hypothetical protein EDM03_14165 [Porphyrobacter sp. IPPAS B-1204]|nr:MAG: hypothetical protein EDM03_14165 [Porphyrobacter sp. IPPAS B-1204]